MKLKDNLTIESEVSDLLINKNFLKFYRKFLFHWSFNIDIFDKNTTVFLEQFLDDDFDFSKIELSKKEILNAIWDIFNIPASLNSFLEYLLLFNKNLDPKDSNLLIEISDYLIWVYNTSNRYNDIWLAQKQLKTKVENILPREVNESRLKLFQAWFSQFTQDELPIIWADFKDFLYTEKWKNPENLNLFKSKRLFLKTSIYK